MGQRYIVEVKLPSVTWASHMDTISSFGCRTSHPAPCECLRKTAEEKSRAWALLPMLETQRKLLTGLARPWPF